MRRAFSGFMSALACGVAMLSSAGAVGAETKEASPVSTNGTQVVDLASTLQLAGARNLDVQLARERLTEARANAEGSLWQFFPWLAPGVSYRRHDNLTQEVGGNIVDVHKDSYTVGPTLRAEVALGDAIYNNLASRQLVKAANEALESRRALTLLEAVQGYFDLVRADAAVGIAREALKITENYFGQVRQAADAGLAFRGDVLRVQVQSERNRMALRQAEEQRHIASARLVEALHLDPATELVPNEKELAPVSLFSTNAVLSSLLARAQILRPELKESQALVQAAEATRKGTVYGPLIPAVGAQVFAGGLGGGRDDASHRFGESEDYQAGISWRIGPGGLFDRSRTRLSESRLRIAELQGKKLSDAISRQVIENHARVRSLADQLAFAQRAVQLADESLRLSEDRRTFAVGGVLETIVSEQELTSARLELATAIAEYNKAQYGLAQAVGGVNGTGP